LAGHQLTGSAMVFSLYAAIVPSYRQILEAVGKRDFIGKTRKKN
jgi:hypothetical protein